MTHRIDRLSPSAESARKTGRVLRLAQRQVLPTFGMPLTRPRDQAVAAGIAARGGTWSGRAEHSSLPV